MELPKITARTAEEVCDASELTEEAQELLSPETSPANFLSALKEADLPVDAIRFLAHALPKADAVRWACLAADRAGEEAAEPEQDCLKAALRWLEDDSEGNRRAAMVVADEDGYVSAAAWAAAAAAWSGGSMAPPELEDVPPPEHLTGTAAASSVLLASTTVAPEEVGRTQHELLDLGLELAAEAPERPGD